MPLDRILDSWYPLARSTDIGKGRAVPLTLLGHELVLFRTLENQPGLLRRHCPHMGGDLSRGRVTNAGLVCPIHHWEFAPDGSRQHTTSTNGNPRRDCQTAIQCVERWGLVFAYLGESPYFELPETQGEVFLAAPVVRDMNMHYTVPSLFGFDNEHFTTVHHREVADMTIYEHHRGHIGTALTTQVGNERWSDRVMQRLGLDEVKNDIDYWAGNIVFGRHSKTRTYALITTLPLDEHRSRVFVVKMCEIPDRNFFSRALAWCQFQLARPLISAFIRQDEHALEGVRFQAGQSRHRPDNPVNQWLMHVDKLPSTPVAALLK